MYTYIWRVLYNAGPGTPATPIRPLKVGTPLSLMTLSKAANKQQPTTNGRKVPGRMLGVSLGISLCMWCISVSVSVSASLCHWVHNTDTHTHTHIARVERLSALLGALSGFSCPFQQGYGYNVSGPFNHQRKTTTIRRQSEMEHLNASPCAGVLSPSRSNSLLLLSLPLSRVPLE